MKTKKLQIVTMILIFLAGFGSLFIPYGVASHRGEDKGRFENECEDQHRIPFAESDNEGNETAGQIAAWLLLAANLPVMVSILIKSTNRFMPLGAELKSALTNFNRAQKKYLMQGHYYLNPVILGVVIWHYISSRCVSTSLPEWGLLLMVGFVVFGILIKFKLCPKAFRKNVYQIHTQPLLFVAMILVLTVGHLIAD